MKLILELNGLKLREQENNQNHGILKLNVVLTLTPLPKLSCCCSQWVWSTTSSCSISCSIWNLTENFGRCMNLHLYAPQRCGTIRQSWRMLLDVKHLNSSSYQAVRLLSHPPPAHSEIVEETVYLAHDSSCSTLSLTCLMWVVADWCITCSWGILLKVNQFSSSWHHTPGTIGFEPFERELCNSVKRFTVTVRLLFPHELYLLTQALSTTTSPQWSCKMVHLTSEFFLKNYPGL